MDQRHVTYIEDLMRVTSGLIDSLELALNLSAKNVAWADDARKAIDNAVIVLTE